LSRAAPRIHYNFFDDQSDRDPLVGPVRLSRKTGRTAPFSALINHQMAPGKRVDDQALRTNIVSNVAAYPHPTLTVPMGADSDPTAVADAWARVWSVEASRVVASIVPDIPSVAPNVTTIMVAERIAAKL